VVGRYFLPDGTLAVRVAGAATDEGDGADAGTGDDTGTEGGGAEGADGADTGTDGAEGDTGTGSDGAGDQEATKWKALARKHEKQAKVNAAELDKLRKAGLSDQEKAVEDAREAARAEARTEFGAKLAAAELKAAGVPRDIVEDLDLSRFLDDQGEVDTDKVAAHAKKYADLTRPSHGSADGGPQGGTPAEKSLDDQIAAARKGGNIDLAISLNNQKLAALAGS